MPTETFKTRLKKLSISKKLVLIGSFVAIIAVFLPWYKDIDKFKTGDMFLGITGPTYLAGLLVLFSGLAVFGTLMLKLLDKPAPKLLFKESHFFLFTSALSILMLILASSVYFHPKFGINLTEKTMGIGMILGFVGAGIVFIGGILDLRKKEVDFSDEGELKPLINMKTKDRVQSSLNNSPAEEPREVKAEVKEEVSQSAFSEMKSASDAEKYQGNGRDMAQQSMKEVLGGHNTNDINRFNG